MKVQSGKSPLEGRINAADFLRKLKEIHCIRFDDERNLRRIMIMIVVTAGALCALVLTMRVLTRWTARSVSRLDQLGTVSHQWLAVHRAEDK